MTQRTVGRGRTAAQGRTSTTILLLTDYLPTRIGGTEVHVPLVGKCLREMGYEVTVLGVIQGTKTDLVLRDATMADDLHVLYVEVDVSHPFVDLDFMKWASRRPLHWLKLVFRVLGDALTSDFVKVPFSELGSLVGFAKGSCYWDSVLDHVASVTRPQLIHSFSGPGTIAAKLNRRTENIQRVWVYTGFPLHGWRNLFSMESSNGIILQEDGTFVEHLGAIGRLGVPIWLTFSKVDGDIVAEAENLDFDILRESLNIPQSAKVISTIGRADPFKGIEEIVRAFPIIARQVPEVTLVLCSPTPPYAIIWGDEKYPETIESLIASLDREVRERIRWIRTGLPRAQTLKLMSKSDVLVFCSPYMNGNIALREAMSVGAAIVASDSPGTSHFIRNGDTGILYQTGNPASLAEAVFRILENTHLQSRIRSEARKRSAKEKFQLQDSLEDLENFYSQVLGQPGGRAGG